MRKITLENYFTTLHDLHSKQQEELNALRQINSEELTASQKNRMNVLRKPFTLFDIEQSHDQLFGTLVRLFDQLDSYKEYEFLIPDDVKSALSLDTYEAAIKKDIYDKKHFAAADIDTLMQAEQPAYSFVDTLFQMIGMPSSHQIQVQAIPVQEDIDLNDPFKVTEVAKSELPHLEQWRLNLKKIVGNYLFGEENRLQRALEAAGHGDYLPALYKIKGEIYIQNSIINAFINKSLGCLIDEIDKKYPLQDNQFRSEGIERSKPNATLDGSFVILDEHGEGGADKDSLDDSFFVVKEDYDPRLAFISLGQSYISMHNLDDLQKIKTLSMITLIVKQLYAAKSIFTTKFASSQKAYDDLAEQEPVLDNWLTDLNPAYPTEIKEFLNALRHKITPHSSEGKSYNKLNYFYACLYGSKGMFEANIDGKRIRLAAGANGLLQNDLTLMTYFLSHFDEIRQFFESHLEQLHKLADLGQQWEEYRVENQAKLYKEQTDGVLLISGIQGVVAVPTALDTSKLAPQAEIPKALDHSQVFYIPSDEDSEEEDSDEDRHQSVYLKRPANTKQNPLNDIIDTLLREANEKTDRKKSNAYIALSKEVRALSIYLQRKSSKAGTNNFDSDAIAQAVVTYVNGITHASDPGIQQQLLNDFLTNETINTVKPDSKLGKIITRIAMIGAIITGSLFVAIIATVLAAPTGPAAIAAGIVSFAAFGKFLTAFFTGGSLLWASTATTALAAQTAACASGALVGSGAGYSPFLFRKPSLYQRLHNIADLSQSIDKFESTKTRKAFLVR